MFSRFPADELRSKYGFGSGQSRLEGSLHGGNPAVQKGSPQPWARDSRPTKAAFGATLQISLNSSLKLCSIAIQVAQPFNLQLFFNLLRVEKTNLPHGFAIKI